MKLFSRVAFWSCLAFVCLSARADLSNEVQTVLQDKLLHRAAVGIDVVRLGASAGESREIFRLEPEHPLVPASNLKLITTSAALDRFGAEFKFRTLLLLHDGNVVLIGDGDPTLGDAEYLKKAGWQTTTVFSSWAAQLKKIGVTSVGDILVDDSVFDQEFVHPHWPSNQLDKRYVAEVGGVSLNANCVDFTVSPTAVGKLADFTLDPSTRYVSVQNLCITGEENAISLTRDPNGNAITMRGQTPARGTASVSVTIHDPPLYAATVLAETLSGAGIKVGGTVRRDRTAREMKDKAGARGWQVVGIHETPLAAVLARANKDSMNLYAESLCKRLGFDATHASGSWQSGDAAVGAFLKRAGVPESEYSLDDGCGLSKQNVISPHAITRVLIYDFFSRNHDTFASSLAVAGVDGTLDDRFRGSDLRRRVFGKSGFVEGVSTLSGYLKARDGQWYAFSIMMNGIPHLSNSGVKVLQERIVKSIDLSTATAAAE